MKIYNEDIVERLSPDAATLYNALCIRSSNLENKLILILELENKILDGLPIIEQDDRNLLLNTIYEYSEYTYSIMELVQQLLRAIWKQKTRAEISSSYNEALKKIANIYRNNLDDATGYYKDGVIQGYILPTQQWYNLLNGIRTDETHSGIGEILVDDTSLNSIIYHNIFRRQVGDYKEVNLKINVFAELNNLMKQFLSRLDTIITYIIDN